MDLGSILTLASAATALLGGVVLAFALGRALWEIAFSIEALSTSLESVADGGDVYIFRGLKARLDQAMRVGGWLTVVGVGLLITSFACSIGTLLLKTG